MRKSDVTWTVTIAAERVEPEDMLRAFGAIADACEEDENADGFDEVSRFFAIGQALGWLGPPGVRQHNRDSRRISEKFLAIEYRLQSLTELIADPRFKKWQYSTDQDGLTMIHRDALVALAKTRLVPAGKQLRVDSDDFFDLLLADTKPDGAA